MAGYISNRWRIYVLSNNGNGTYMGIHQIMMKTEAGGDNVAQGGSVTASSNHSTWVPEQAFDGSDDVDVYGGWLTQSAGVNQWIEYQFIDPVNIVEIEMKAMPSGTAGGGDQPDDFRIEAYVGDEWVIVQEYTGVGPSWGQSTWKTFAASEVFVSSGGTPAYALRGYTVTAAGRPVSRNVHVYDRVLGFIDTVVSDPQTGFWELQLATDPVPNPCTVIFEDTTGLYNNEIRTLFPIKYLVYPDPV